MQKPLQALLDRLSRVISSASNALNNSGQQKNSTENKHLEEQLKTLSCAVEQSPCTIVIADLDGNIKYVNPKFTQLTGYTYKEAIGQNPRILQSGITTPGEYEHLWKLITSGKEWRGEFCNKKKNGESYWESASISPVKNSQGTITHFVAVKEDITERKKMEEKLDLFNKYLEERVTTRTEELRERNAELKKEIAERIRFEETLKESEEKFRKITSSAFDTIIMMDDKGNVSFWNEAAGKMFGYSRKEVVGKKLHKLIVPERYYEGFKKGMEDFRKDGIGLIINKSLVLPGLRRDGTEFLADHSFSSAKIKGKWHAISIIRDITEREKIDIQEKRNIFANNFSRLCRDFVELKPVTELVTKGLAELLNVQRASVWLLDDSNNLVCQKLYEHPENSFSEGTVLSGENYPEYLKAILEDSPIDAQDARTDPRTKEFLKDYLIPLNIYSMLDTPVKLKGKVSGVLCLEQTEHLRKWQKDEIEFANTITAQLSNAIGRIIECKKAEAELTKSYNLLNSILEETTDIIFVKDLSGRYLMINSAGAHLIGKPVEEIIGKGDAELFTHEIALRLIKEDQEVIASGKGKAFDEEIPVNGKINTFHTTKVPYHDYVRNIIGVIGIARDITERKQTEKRLNAQHAVTKVLAESTTLKEASPRILSSICMALEWDLGEVWLFDPKNNVLRCAEFWNVPSIEVSNFKSITRHMTFSRGKGLPGTVFASAKPVWKADVAKDTNFLRASVAAKEGLHGAFCFPILSGNDVLGTISFYSHEFRQPDENLLSMMTAIGRQIGLFIRRKHAEVKLASQEELYRTLVETIPHVIWVGNAEGNITFLNKAWKEWTGRDVADSLGDKWAESLHSDDAEKLLAKWERAYKYGESYTGECRFKTKEGSYKTITFIGTPVKDSSGKIISWIGINMDITERKKSEEQIKASLKEKEVLLDEIHHRVKNNLQIISSLLDMSSMQSHNQETIELFAESRSRVESMSLVHSQLYESERFDEIDMEKHIQELFGNLLKIYSKEEIITLDIKTANVYLPVTLAVPCALVLNELISNSLKHAYRDGQQGTISISMQQNDDTILAKVKDNGIGIPDEIDIEKTNSLGLKLVRNIVYKQLNGKIKLIRNKGAEFIMEFNISKEKS